MAFTQSENRLTKENILDRVDSYQLFQAYCKNFSAMDRMFKSDFRQDNSPSCHIIMWEGDLLYKDFGERGYRAFDYIARKFNTDFQGALQIINRDFGLDLGKKDSKVEITRLDIPEKAKFDLKDFEPRPTVIEINKRRWTSLDRAYWKQYDIPPLLLKYHKIYSIDAYRIDSKFQDDVSYRVAPDQLAFSFDYYWHKGIFRRKLYFPQVKGKFRFISNVDKTITQGWTLLPKHEGQDTLFITKSYKDILTFNMLGYWAIAPNSEHSFIPDKVMDKLKRRFRNIYVWFDNDEGGLTGGRGFADKFNLPFTHNPLNEPKDPSDFVKEYSLNQFDNLVTQFLTNEGHHSFSPKFSV